MTTNSSAIPALVPLRIPGGWIVRHNQLVDVDPQTLPPDHADWVLLSEDLLLVERTRDGFRIDVGWYPDGRPEGGFTLRVVLDDDWRRPILRFQTRSRTELVDKCIGSA